MTMQVKVSDICVKSEEQLLSQVPVSQDLFHRTKVSLL